MRLVLANEVADRRRRDQHLDRADASPAVGGRHEGWHTTPSSTSENWVRTCCSMRGKEVDHRRWHGPPSSQGGQGQTGLGYPQRRLGGLEIAHLADEHHVGSSRSAARNASKPRIATSRSIGRCGWMYSMGSSIVRMWLRRSVDRSTSAASVVLFCPVRSPAAHAAARPAPPRRAAARAGEPPDPRYTAARAPAAGHLQNLVEQTDPSLVQPPSRCTHRTRSPCERGHVTAPSARASASLNPMSRRPRRGSARAAARSPPEPRTDRSVPCSRSRCTHRTRSPAAASPHGPPPR